jgi:hypothetical protein
MKLELPVYRSLPDPWRGWIGLRRLRRWLQALALARRHNRRVPRDAPTINFYPMRPGPNSSLAHVLARLPVRIGHSTRGGAMRFAWDTGTGFRTGAAERLAADAVNRRCLDISKGNVDRTWASVAGYSISVDPLTTHGPMVEKPEENGRHAGRVVEGPLQRRAPGMVYQRLVESLADDGRILQLRVVVIGSRIVFTYGKWRPYGNWFKGTELTLPRPTDELLSAHEQDLVLRFADAMALEYGELDALRDRDGRLYVVDANRTPVLPKGLPPDAAGEAFAMQAEALSRLIGG